MEENFAKQVIMEAIDLAMKSGNYGIVETMNIVKAIEALRLNIKSDNEQHNLELN
jgi:plastocyanin domain-containing protein